jgi:hypothetical protein
LLPLPQSTRQRLSQLQLMALVCVYVRKANYFQQGKNFFNVKWNKSTPSITNTEIFRLKIIIKWIFFRKLTASAKEFVFYRKEPNMIIIELHIIILFTLIKLRRKNSFQTFDFLIISCQMVCFSYSFRQAMNKSKNLRKKNNSNVVFCAGGGWYP